jgi:hypothetical protein
MRFAFILLAVISLPIIPITGCNSSSPAPIPAIDSVEKPKQLEIKDLDGLWLLKSSSLSSERGIYPLNTKGGEEMVLKMRDGVAEMRKGKGPWTKYGTISIGSEPSCLQVAKPDITGQQMVFRLRYKLEGNTLTTVQDNIYPDVLPDSFLMEGVIDRQRQTNTYVKTDR